MAEENVVVIPPNVPASPETFTREYVTELRNESKSYRLKSQELEAKTQAAEAKATQAVTDADAKVATATQAANDRVVRAELKAVAIKAGMVDLDGLKLADLTKVKLNDAGEVEGADALMKALKEAKPYLFQVSGTTTQTEDPPPNTPPGTKHARDMTGAEYAAAKAALLK